MKPQVFDSASIFFCDIVSFTSICSVSTAHQIIDFLNDLWQMFDVMIDDYDVYKVETIGDAYMVASGVPNPNGTQHAVEISNMALNLLAKVNTFEIKHKPNMKLQLRMGIHCGQVRTDRQTGYRQFYISFDRLSVEWWVVGSRTTPSSGTPWRSPLSWRAPEKP